MTNKEIQKEVNKWLKDWQKFEPKAQDYREELEQYGLLTKKGNIKYAKSVTQELRQFYNSKVKNNTYSQYEERKRIQYENLDNPSETFEEFMYNEYNYTNLINELFKKFDSNTAYEEKSYLDMISRSEAIERLQEELKTGEIGNSLETYKTEYGQDYEPPF